jgi:hypothetical protein
MEIFCLYLYKILSMSYNSKNKKKEGIGKQNNWTTDPRLGSMNFTIPTKQAHPATTI